jgi:hypothetical protein
LTSRLPDLSTCARTVYSQTGEEGVLEAIFSTVGETNRYLVDIGAGDGSTLSNTRLFLDRDWTGTRFDIVPHGDVHRAMVTAENIGALLAEHVAPHAFDLLSLDIDGIDWYVLRALLREGYRPRVFVCEINNSLPAEPPLVIAYDPTHVFNDSDYFGASLGAYRRLAEAYGYVLVHCLPWNAFFVQRELLDGRLTEVEWSPQATWPADPLFRPWRVVTGNDLP